MAVPAEAGYPLRQLPNDLLQVSKGRVRRGQFAC
jgi:hypothetical protein